jgi:hypothetical protein
MPILELTPGGVGPNRTQLALSYVGGVMLWPGAEDQARRDEWMTAQTAGFIRNAVNDVPAARRAAEMARLINGYDLALAATPLGVLGKRAEQPSIHGCLAGELFFAAIEAYAADGRLKLEAIKHAMVSSKRRKAGRFRGYRALDISRSSLENTVWARFKHVSPLWASYLAGFQGEPEFPCSLSRLPDFLGVAKLLETQGLAIIPHARKDPVLDPARIWRIPDHLPLPSWALAADWDAVKRSLIGHI